MFTPKIIANIKSPYKTKFGVPRQSMINSDLSLVVFDKQFSREEALRGIEEFSHIWLIWYIDKNPPTDALTVRPPKLGGNKRLGVFATRSPFRPNPIGLSLVKLEGITAFDGKIALKVSGADLVDGTPILDIKPYLPYSESLPKASGSFTENVAKTRLYVDFPIELQRFFNPFDAQKLMGILSLDPRPGYHDDADRIYGIIYLGHDVHFKVNNGVLTVTDVVLPSFCEKDNDETLQIR